MDSDNTFVIAVASLIAFVGWKFWQKYGGEIMTNINAFISLPWQEIGLAVLSLVASLFILWKFYKWFKRRRQRKKSEESQKSYRLNSIKLLLDEDFEKCNSLQVMSKLDVIRKKLLEYPAEETALFQSQFEKLYRKAPLLVQEKRHQEELAEQERLELENEKLRQEALKKRRESEQKRRFEKAIEALLAYKIKTKNPESIPVGRVYAPEIMSVATFRAEKYFEQQEWLKQTRDEAVEYYSRYDIDSIPQLDKEKEITVYSQVRSEIKSGSLSVDKKAGLSYGGKKLEKVFYRAPELTREEKLRARKQGFEYIRGNELDGYVSGGFYINRRDSQETSFHFYMKYLFAELHDNMQIEKDIKGRRVDVYLNIEDFKLGIEIETGKNKLNDLAEKTAWLNEHFDQWIYVCKKNLLPRYAQFVDGKKSFCLTPKEAKNFVKEICYYH